MERYIRSEMKYLIVAHSYHHKNNLVIANDISEVLNVVFRTVENINIEELDIN